MINLKNTRIAVAAFLVAACSFAFGQQDVTQPGDPIIASSPNSPGSEGVANAIDNQPTKYLNFDSGRDGADGGFSPSGFVVSPQVGATIVTGLVLQSANDAPNRDPRHVRLEGSNDAAPGWDSGSWAVIYENDGIAEFPERFENRTFNFDNATPYLHYRYTLVGTQSEGANGCCMQIAEVELLGKLGPSDVTQPGDPIIASSPNSPGSEGVANAIDNQPTKYLNFDSGRDGADAGFGPSGFVVSPSVGSTIVSGIVLQSANDAPNRDPRSIRVEGSNDAAPGWDSGNWTTIYENDAIAEFPERFQNQTFYFDNKTPYLHYRYSLLATQSEGANGCCMQIAEVELLGKLGPSDVTQPGDPIIASSPNSPGSEGVANAIDNQPTKYLNFDSGRDGADAGFGPSGFVVSPSVGSTIVTGLVLQSANDAPNRDPRHVRLEGSNDPAAGWDSGNWTVLYENDGIAEFPERFQNQTFFFDNGTPYAHYRYSLLATQSDGANGCCMQIAEVELLGVSGPVDVTQPGDTIYASSPNSPGSEGVANAIDGQPTKYLNFDSGRDGSDGGFSPSGFAVTPGIGATTIIGVSMQSANDAPNRDPETIRIQGTNDAISGYDDGNWTDIAVIDGIQAWTDLFGDDNRFQTQSFYFDNASSYTSYRWILESTQSDGANGCCMQIAEVELLALTDSVPCGQVQITRQPVDTPVLAGESATLLVEVNGPWPVQWFADGEAIAGATQTVYETPAVTADNEGTVYSVQIGDCEETMSNGVMAVILDPAEQPVSIGVNFIGGGANGAPTLIGDTEIAGVQLQAYWNNAGNEDLSDGSSSGTVFPTDSRGDASSITVNYESSGRWGAGTGDVLPTQKILNGNIEDTGAGSSISFWDVPAGNHAVIIYTVNRPLLFESGKFEVEAGGNVLATAYATTMNADQHNPIQRFFRGTSETQENQTLANYVELRFNHPGGTDLNVNFSSTSADRIAVNAVQLVLNPGDSVAPPQIVENPRPGLVLADGNAVITAEASGEGLTYQWLLNGSPVVDGGTYSGATSNTLVVRGFNEDTEGAYSVAVFNAGGSIISGGASVSVGPASLSTNSGLIAYYPFDENGGSSASNNGSGASAAKTFDGAGFDSSAALGSAGLVGNALTLDGFTYAFVENSPAITDTLTVSAWVNVSSEAANSLDVPSFVRNGTGDQFDLGLILNDVDFTFHLGGSIEAGPNTVRAQDSSEFPLDEWVHVALVADGNQIRLYKNGDVVGSTAYLDNINPPSADWVSIGAKLLDEGFGPLPDVSLPDFMWGQIDDLGIWNQALTDADISAIVEAGNAGEAFIGIARQGGTSVAEADLPTPGDGGGDGDGDGGGDAPGIAVLPLDAVTGEGTGLDGRYWQASPKEVVSLAENGLGLMSRPADGTFTATGLSFSGNDLTPIAEWLADDGASYAGLEGNLDDGLISFNGWVRIDEPGEIAIRSESDDGSIIWIGNEKVVDNDGSHGSPGPAPDGSYNFTAPGLYPIEIAWFNGDWTNDAGDHGGANINVLAGGNPIPGAILYGSADLGYPSIGASTSVASTDNANGLYGEYFQSGPDTIDNLQNFGGEKDLGLQIIRGSSPTGRFVSSTIDYTGGNDLTPIDEWLGEDAASYVGAAGNMDDGLIGLSGWIQIDEAGAKDFRSESDDGSVVWIGGQMVIDNDGTHGSPGPNPDGSAFFPSAGLYPIEVAYFNSDWTNDAGDHGGANIRLLSGGEPIPADKLFLPSSSIMLSSGDVGTGLDDDDDSNNDPAEAGSAEISAPFPDVFDVDVTAGGGDIWGSADRGHFVWTDVSGDFDTSVQVTRLDPINRWSKAGISVRESIDADSRHVWVNVDSDGVPTSDGNTGADRYELGLRAETGGNMSDWPANGGDPIVGNLELDFPTWIRVTREGNTFTGYRGTDGVNWTPMSTIDFDLPDSVVLALGTTSHDNNPGQTTTAHYRSWTINPLASGPVEDIVIEFSVDGGNLVVSWNRGTLQSAPAVTGPWANVQASPGRGQAPVDVSSPHSEATAGPGKFYRVVD